MCSKFKFKCGYQARITTNEKYFENYIPCFHISNFKELDGRGHFLVYVNLFFLFKRRPLHRDKANYLKHHISNITNVSILTKLLIAE